MYEHFRINLPAVQLKIKKEATKSFVFDVIRKKYVVLTPEEWVRQHVIHYLIDHHAYPRSLFKVEGGLHYNRLQKRTDIVVHDRNGSPWMLVECKAPTLKVSQSAFNQIALYNMTVGARYLLVTNGCVHYCFEAHKDGSKPTYLSSLPPFL